MSEDNITGNDKSSENVSHLAQAEIKRSKKKPKIKEIHAQIVEAMLGNHGRLPPFPEKLHRWVDHSGSSLPYKEDKQGVVRYVATDYLNHLISLYWDRCQDVLDGYWGSPSADDISKVRRLWFAKSKGREERWLTLTFASDKRPALKKVNISSGDHAGIGDMAADAYRLCPAWNNLMSRIADHKILMAWIGSLFDPDSQRQQYIWLYGKGGEGKGSLIRAITKILGCAASSETIYDIENRFWTFGIRDRRLVVFPDCDNPDFISTGIFKSLTGEDEIRMEKKAGEIWSQHIDAKFLISSNVKPNISSGNADLRRCLIFNVEPVNEMIEDFDKKLDEDADMFIESCWFTYQKMINGNSRHVFKQENRDFIENIVAENEYDYDFFCNDWLDIQIDESADIPNHKKYWMDPVTMNQLMIKAGFSSQREQKKLRNHLLNKGAKYTIIKIPSENGLIVRRVWLHVKPSIHAGAMFPKTGKENVE